MNCITEKNTILQTKILQSQNSYMILFIILFLLKSKFIGIWFVLKQK